MTATTVIADRPAEVRIRKTPSETRSQENTEAKENRPKNTVVHTRVRLRPHRSARPPATTEPMNMPTKDSEVT